MTDANTTKTIELAQQAETKDTITILSERSKISGSASPEFTRMLKNQTIYTLNGVGKNDNVNLDAFGTIAEGALAGLNPRDEAEGMLMAQMIGIHNAAMNALLVGNVASDLRSVETCEIKTNLAIKLIRTYATQMQTLHMYRGNNQESKVNVSRVHVHDGGQAIVGNVKQDRS